MALNRCLPASASVLGCVPPVLAKCNCLLLWLEACATACVCGLEVIFVLLSLWILEIGLGLPDLNGKHFPSLLLHLVGPS